VEGHGVADLFRHVVEVGPVALGNDHVGQARRVGGQHLLFQPADRQHATLQGHLAGHADGVLDRTAAEQRGQGGRHRHAGARPILGYGACGDVDVELPLVEGVLVNPQVPGVPARVGEGDPRRLLHDVAELARQDEALLALHRGGLDEQHIAADRRVRQPGGHSGHRRALRGLLPEALAAECVADHVQVDGDRRLDLLRGEPRGGLAQDRPELALEIADARLPRVLGHHRAQRLVLDRHLVLAQPVALALARP
jgi:hypothetical protein